MNANTEPDGWSVEEVEAAKRIAAKTGKTSEDVQREAIRKHVQFSRRGARYRADILGMSDASVFFDRGAL